MRIYLAALFSQKPHMECVADYLKSCGHEIISSWVYGGEEGLTLPDIALLDIGDVDRADTVVSFTCPKGTFTVGGGRHTEFGYGLAKGKRMIVIGEREHLFHWYPNVEIYSTVNEWLNHDKEHQPQGRAGH